MGLLNAFQRTPGFNPMGGAPMTNQAAPNAAPPQQQQGMGGLQSFMGQFGQRPQGQGLQPNMIRPPMSNAFQAPSHLAANDFGPVDPSAVRDPTGRGMAPGDQVLGYGDVVMGLPGVNFYQPEGYGIFRSNSPQNGYPTWDNAGAQQPIADFISGMINPFGGLGGGGGGSGDAGGAQAREGSGFIKRNKN